MSDHGLCQLLFYDHECCHETSGQLLSSDSGRTWNTVCFAGVSDHRRGHQIYSVNRGIAMFISAAVKNNVLTLLLSLAVVYGPMMIAEYLPYGMQKALDLIPLVGSSTDIFRTNTFRIFGKLIWSPYLLITIPVLIGILCMPFAIKSWSRRMKA